MTDDITAIRELLNIQLGHIREEIARVATAQERQNNIVENIVKENIVQRGDIKALLKSQNQNSDDIKKMMARIEADEAIQIKNWNDQVVINATQGTINAEIHKKSERNITMQYGAIGTFITLLITYLWGVFTGK